MHRGRWIRHSGKDDQGELRVLEAQEREDRGDQLQRPDRDPDHPEEKGGRRVRAVEGLLGARLQQPGEGRLGGLSRLPELQGIQVD